MNPGKMVLPAMSIFLAPPAARASTSSLEPLGRNLPPIRPARAENHGVSIPCMPSLLFLHPNCGRYTRMTERQYTKQPTQAGDSFAKLKSGGRGNVKNSQVVEVE